MKVTEIKNLQGTEKFGTCIECGKDSYCEEDLVRLNFGYIHQVSICLCPSCLNRLISKLKNY